MKPMLMYQKNPDLSKIQYPVYVVPKLDGIRCLTVDGKAMSRSLKPIPNKQVQRVLADFPSYLDGELIVGNPTSPTVFLDTTSFVRSTDKEMDGQWKYYVFDDWFSEKPYYERQRYLLTYLQPFIDNSSYITIVETAMAEHEDDVLALEERYVGQGYEGVILRNPHGIYKYGRTTEKENNAYKLKRFADSEGIVQEIIPEYYNGNEAKVSPTGRTERSSSAAGLVAKDSMGAIVVYDPILDWKFNIGTGFSAEERRYWWNNREQILNDKPLVAYKYFPVGSKDAPRHPVFKGIRERFDL